MYCVSLFISTIARTLLDHVLVSGRTGYHNKQLTEATQDVDGSGDPRKRISHDGAEITGITRRS